jgi:hypothetical protein
MGLKDRAGQDSSFALMYDNFQSKRDKKAELLSLSYRQRTALEAVDALDALAPLFGSTQYTDDDYLAVRRTLNEIIERNYETDDPVFNAVGWWWDQVRPYFDAKNEVWEKIKQTEKNLRGPLYRQLTEIENEWAEKKLVHDKWGVMPDVQTVMFSRLSPDAQELKKYGWASLPVEFLSQFQRQTLYGKTKKDEELNELVLRIGDNEEALDRIVGERVIHTSSLEYEALRKQTDMMNKQAAEELGVLAQYQKWQAPAYKRVGSLIQNPYWTQIESFIDQGRRMIEASDAAPGGQTTGAVFYQVAAVEMIDDFRAKGAEFDSIMKVLEIAYGEGPDEPAVGVDMYWELFFDGFGSPPKYLSYQKGV